jgi:phosphogluconate dehydratase
LRKQERALVAIISSYNDILSAHQPFENFPNVIKQAIHDVGAVVQFAGGVPAMCDGVTQGQPGMELSLFSRDTIAMSTAIALSHNIFDAGLYLGVCDKIVPGLLIGALHFGHLPAVFVPAGPMPSGLSNKKKAHVRQLYAKGKATWEELLECEAQSYHAAGTCTFYGTANSNQMLMEIMGLHLPGAAFITPGTPLRDALTVAAAQRAVAISSHGEGGGSCNYMPIGRLVDEKSIVNAIVGLLATGGSTNHTLHLVAIARAAGIVIDWDDFNELSSVVPLLARIYPNGDADVNHFHAAGGPGFVIRELLDTGLVHEDVNTILGCGLRAHCRKPTLDTHGKVVWHEVPKHSGDENVVRPASKPFSKDGGLIVVSGNLGRAIMKVSAICKEQRYVVEAPALTFDSQEAFMHAYKAGQLNRDFVAVLRLQGPRANGMPELHALTPALSNLQDAGHRVALVTDGRMSGASGKVPTAIHVSPETLTGGPLGLVRDGDIIRLDAHSRTLEALVPHPLWAQRSLAVTADSPTTHIGMGRELFSMFRHCTSDAETGAVTFPLPSATPTTAY